MYEIKKGNKFRKSIKRISSSQSFSAEKLEDILTFLSQGKELPKEYYDHALAGGWSGVRECHLSGDCLLLYEINHIDKDVRLINIGNHANLFE